MAKNMSKKKVFVGLSGGVDSSVSAALLQKAGFDVSGVFIKVWQPAFWGGCTMKEDRLDAMRVCARLNIPFYTLDLEKEYKKEVVDYMIAEYKAGRTPNPDVMCNKYVKFGLPGHGGFFAWAMKQGADYVATGHYARISCQQGNSLIFDIKEFPCCLLAGKDKNKDQSYFLWTLKKEQLSKILFPVGDIEKPEVRKLAKKFNLETAAKKDSQGLCFIGKVDMMDFLKNFIKTKIGKVLNEKGEIIGHHQGAELYTIGERHGFTIEEKTNNSKPYFIIAKDVLTNTLTVSHNPLKTEALSGKEIELKDINWIAGIEPDFKKEYSARIRYRQPLEKCRFNHQGSTLMVVFQKPQKAPAPGQSVVFYDKEVCLGGGIIK